MSQVHTVVLVSIAAHLTVDAERTLDAVQQLGRRRAAAGQSHATPVHGGVTVDAHIRHGRLAVAAGGRAPNAGIRIGCARQLNGCRFIGEAATANGSVRRMPIGVTLIGIEFIGGLADLQRGLVRLLGVTVRIGVRIAGVALQ